MENKAYTHILQKKGVLKTFSVAKVVKRKEIEELKNLIKNIASNEFEYNQMLKEEIDKISNMHDETNPIPGIIYSNNSKDARRNLIFIIAQKISDKVKSQKFTKQEMALLISSIISKLELDQDDFIKLNEELSEDLEEDDSDEEDSEF